jgi:protein tyrosine phosphatase (PTP) superfamily phosphohydrolase (DUF442 family)
MRNAGRAALVIGAMGAGVLGGCIWDTSDGGPNSRAFESRVHSTNTGLNAERPIFPSEFTEHGGTFENGAWRVGDVFVTGQPDEAALRDLIENQGVTLLVNLRTPAEMERLRTAEENAFDEAAFVRPYTVSHGVEYLELPIGGEEHPPTPAQVDAFAEALARHESGALLKCTSAGRSSQMWAAYLVRRWGFDVNQAREHAMAMASTPSTMERLLGEEFEYRVKGE